MSDFAENTCMNCKHLKVDDNTYPCKECFAWDHWEQVRPRTADEVIKDWERRMSDGNSSKY